jgi:hypothetical protein
VSGQFMTEDGAMPGGRTGFALAATLVDADRAPDQARDADDGRMRGDGSVALGGLFGRARLRARVPDGWSVKAIVHDGSDISDMPMELASGETLRDVRVIVTNRPTSVRAQIVDVKGAPLASGTVLVFPRDAAKWFEESRWIGAARPDQQGNTRIDGLPPGEYLAVALDYVEEGMWHDADFIGSLRVRGQAFTLAEAETRSMTLRVVAAPAAQ